MRLLLINHIENAIDSLRSTRTRSLLTMLGISIGVAAVTLILSLSSGATKIITDQVQQLDGNLIVIRPGANFSPTQIENITAPANLDFAASTLTETDIASLRSVPNIEAIAPIMTISGSVKSDSTIAPPYTPIVATTPDLMTISALKMREGQFIGSLDNRDAAVVGVQLSINIFGTEDSIGQTFKIRGHEFLVVGVLDRHSKPINYNNIAFDQAAIINLSEGKTLNHGVAQIQQINIKATSIDNLPNVIKGVKNVLDKNHLGEKDYTILSGNEVAKPLNQLYYTFAATMVAVAAVSLIVGGIGIMNIMLVSVAERTREIGVRKSLGASHGHIVWQFLIESLALSVSGGILGYFMGYLVGFGISRSFLTFDPVFSWQIAGTAFAMSIFIGTIFGLYPAIRAARKDPIEALRQYQ